MARKPDPPPLRTDDVRTVRIGAGLWAAGLVASVAAQRWEAAWTCAAGLALGFVGIAYTKRRAAAIARDEAARTSPDGPGGAGS